jgi:hypothetical protein
MCLDAANVKSYPSSGTAWNDMCGLSNNGALVNGPTYDANNAGSIVFDGVNDGFSASGFTLSKTQFSLEWWFYPIANINYNQAISLNGAWTGFIWHTGSSSQYWAGTDIGTRFENVDAGSVSVNTWQQWTFTFDNGAAKIYKNATLLQSKNMSLSTDASYTSLTDSNSTNGRRSVIKLYNRALSAAEVLQNFNALRGRYGI